MKKICLFLLVLSIAVSAIACDSSDTNISDKTESSAESVDSSDSSTDNKDGSDTISDHSSKNTEDASSDDLSDASSDITSDTSSDTTSDDSSDISNDTSSEFSDNESSSDISDDPIDIPALPEYPKKYTYKDCAEFVANEKDAFVRFLNPERLGEIYEIDSIFPYPNARYPRYSIQSVYTEVYDTDMYGIDIYPLEDISTDIMRYLKWEFSQFNELDVIPTTRTEEFMKTTSCYQYKKEGVDVFLVGYMYKDWENQKIECSYIYACCKIDGYIFIIDSFYNSANPNIEMLPTEERAYGWKYDRWPTQEEYEANPIFKDCEWKYELLNIYNEDSQLIALLKEMVAEQG